MASLLMILWISVASIGVRHAGPGSLVLDWLQIGLQLTCVAAASAQAGRMESGRDSRVRRPLQAVALVGFLALLALSAPGVAARLGLP